MSVLEFVLALYIVSIAGALGALGISAWDRANRRRQ